MKRFLLLMATGVLFLSTQETQAFIWSFGGEEIAKVADLPNTDEWMTDDGDHADLSVIYQQVWILWIPIWNWDARYCGSTARSRENTEFYPMDGDTSEFVSKYGSPEGMIPFWDRIGGKLVWALIILIWGKWQSGKD